MSRKSLLIFAKAPVPGRVKTRLMPFLSAQQAAQLHRQLVSHCFEQIVFGQSDYRVELWVDQQDDFWLPFQHQFDGEIFLQSGDDLGARMQHALDSALTRADVAVVIGTDCPDLNRAYVSSAFDWLTAEPEHDIVLGPAEDGGYVLLGLKQSHAAIFSDIDWGSEYVLSQTLSQIKACALTYSLLPALSDIDRPADLQALQQRMPWIGVF